MQAGKRSYLIGPRAGGVHHDVGDDALSIGAHAFDATGVRIDRDHRRVREETHALRLRVTRQRARREERVDLTVLWREDTALDLACKPGQPMGALRGCERLGHETTLPSIRHDLFRRRRVRAHDQVEAALAQVADVAETLAQRRP